MNINLKSKLCFNNYAEHHDGHIVGMRPTTRPAALCAPRLYTGCRFGHSHGIEVHPLVR